MADNKDMGQEVIKTMQDKAAQPENDRRVLMQNVYDTSMQSVQLGLESDVMKNGTLNEKRDFMANVMSANLYGKQLATKDNPMLIPDISVDEKDNILLTMQEYRPSEATYDLGSAKTYTNRIALDGVVSEQEQAARNSMKDVSGYVDAKQDGKDSDYKITADKENVVEKVKNAAIVGSSVGVGAMFGGLPGAAVGIAMGTVGKKALVESRRSVPDKVVSQAISADKRSSRIAQAEALVKGLESKSDTEAEFA